MRAMEPGIVKRGEKIRTEEGRPAPPMKIPSLNAAVSTGAATRAATKNARTMAV